jgi:hypothetical protein
MVGRYSDRSGAVSRRNRRARRRRSALRLKIAAACISGTGNRRGDRRGPSAAGAHGRSSRPKPWPSGSISPTFGTSNCKRPTRPCMFDRFSRSWPRTSFEMNGPASLTNREIARSLRTNYSKPTFSAATGSVNDASTAGYFWHSNGWFSEIGTRWRCEGIRTSSSARASMGKTRPELGALFGPNKSIRAGENLFA